MKLWIFSLYLCLVLTQAAPLDKLRQQAARASRVAEASNTDASLSFLEKQQELAFEMEKESKHDITEADAVENLAKSEVEEAAAQGAQAGSQAAATESSQTSSQQAQQQTTQDQSTTTTTTTTNSQTQASDTQQQQQTAAAAATTTQSTPTAPEKTENKKPMEWEDAVLVEDLTKERASADANTKYIGANMKSSKVGTPKAPSFLQMGPPMYYPVHPAFLQQAQRMRSQQKTTEGRSEEGTSTRAKGWGDYGTPLYWAEQFGSYDGLGAAGANMYGNYGYAPYASGYNPMYTQAAGGNSMIGSTPPYFEYGGFAGYAPYAAPSPPPVPADLPAPPYIQPAGTR